jgi:quercetin dioxygenase-like cupin family protein
MFQSATGWQQGGVHNPGAGKPLDIAGVRITFKVTGEETGGAFSVSEAMVPPHFAGVHPHVHRQMTQAFFMVEGTLAFMLNYETVTVQQGSFIFVPAGVVHQFWNPTAASAIFLAFLSPAGFEHYLEALARLPANGAAESPANTSKVESLGREYDIFSAFT